MTHHKDEEPKTEEQPKIDDGLTAPQDVDNPGERTTSPGEDDPDPERLERAREEQDRTIAT